MPTLTMAKIFKADFLKMAKMQIGPFGSEPSKLVEI